MSEGTPEKTGVQKSDKKRREKTEKKKKGIKELKKELKEKDMQLNDYLTKLQYLQAEFENYKKMVTKEKENTIKFSNEELITELIDVYENLERAIQTGKNTDDKDALLEGVDMTFTQLKTLLQKHGLKEIKAVGQKFDPYKHEVLIKEEKKDVEEDTILEEFQKGYMLKDKVIRYSKVKVSTR